MELTATESTVPTRREIVLGLARMVFAFAVLLGIVALLGIAFRPQLERFGHWFVDRFGMLGMAAGAFLADGLHVPLPPQFYLLTGIAGGVAAVPALASVTIGSVLGGLAIFAVSRRASGVRFLEKRITTTRTLVEKLMDRYGSWGLVIAGLLPVSYFVLCALGGLMGLRYRSYGVLALMRIPRLLLSYAVIVLAWGLG